LVGGYFSPEIVTVMTKPSCIFCEYAMHTLEEMLKDEKTRFQC
jgi:glutaredoxin